MSNGNTAMIDVEDEVDTDVKDKVKLYPRWKVLYHNDDKTTMQYVVYTLMRYFGHNKEKANEIMMEVHLKKVGLAGVYHKEWAEVKRDQVISDARTNGWPLQVSIEPDKE
jgi:ATP-dependent Clp protease adaptor protein ClpS